MRLRGINLTEMAYSGILAQLRKSFIPFFTNLTPSSPTFHLIYAEKLFVLLLRIRLECVGVCTGDPSQYQQAKRLKIDALVCKFCYGERRRPLGYVCY